MRIPESIAKVDRILAIYRNDVLDTPELVFEVLERQKERLLSVHEEKGDYISPFDLS